MKLFIPALLFVCLFSISAFAQKAFTVKGSVVDTSSKVKLVNTTVCILSAKDSTLRKFTYAGNGGSFEITGLPAGKYILLTSYTDYADYTERFTLDSAHTNHDFGALSMELKMKILQDVIIKGHAAAEKIKGDTIEFNAKAYVIQPNDNVEDLLRQFPGIKVDKNGKITANGQDINKVLVDGEEFFGDDPTLVTKNLRADMVDKVQLYDKKSDQASFTGIDDGVKTKTLNIKLKEDKKTGAFGKFSAGVATDDYYEGQAIYNRFKAKEKYSAYLTVANDGKTGLGFNETNRLGASSDANVTVGDDGSLSIMISGNDELDSFRGNYDGNGSPLARSGGVHYDDKWNGDKESINTNYKIGSMEVTGNTATTTQETLPTGTLNTKSNQTFDNYAFRQKMDASYSIKLDTASTLKVSADGTLRHFSVNDNYGSEATGTTNNLINQQTRSVRNSGDEQLYNVSAFYTHKFKKARRTFSWNISEKSDNNDAKGYLISKTDFFNATTGLKDSTQNVNQYKTTNTLSSILSSNMTYTEPLSKTLSLVFSYGLGINNTTQDKKSFDQSAPGVYNILDAAYSNDYHFNQLTNQVGAIFNYKKNKMILNFGTKASDVSFKQIDENSGAIYRRSFINWNPQAGLQYKVSDQTSFNINYTGRTTQPTISQIQPVLINTDPQNIVIGNTGLKSSFSHDFNFQFNTYKEVSESGFYFYGYLSLITDQIVDNVTTDALTAKTVSQYVNLPGKTPLNYYLSGERSIKIEPVGINAGLDFNLNGNISYSYNNGQINRGVSNSYQVALDLSKYVAKAYQLSVNGGPKYTVNEFSLLPANNNNAGGFELNSRATWFLPAKFQLSSDVNYSFTAATTTFTAQYKTIWNASLDKTFLKDDKLKISLSARDLLGQNINFTRGINSNTVTQTSTNGIKRYFMLSVSWDFTKFGTMASAEKK